MDRFIIVDGLPYLYAGDKAYAVRWDDKGFTVGAEVELAETPEHVYSELSILAKCHEDLDSIKEAVHVNEDDSEGFECEERSADKEISEMVSELSEMSLDELKEYAKDHDIKLNGARTKTAIIEAIDAAE